MVTHHRKSLLHFDMGIVATRMSCEQTGMCIHPRSIVCIARIYQRSLAYGEKAQSYFLLLIQKEEWYSQKSRPLREGQRLYDVYAQKHTHMLRSVFNKCCNILVLLALQQPEEDLLNGATYLDEASFSLDRIKLFPNCKPDLPSKGLSTGTRRLGWLLCWLR